MGSVEKAAYRTESTKGHIHVLLDGGIVRAQLALPLLSVVVAIVNHRAGKRVDARAVRAAHRPAGTE